MIGRVPTILIAAWMAQGAPVRSDQPQQVVEATPLDAPAKPEPSAKPDASADQAQPKTIPGLSPETFNVPPGRYFPEGTFLVRRTGTVRILKTGDAVFIPDPPAQRDPRRRGERPMLLLPSQTLAALQSSIATSASPDETRVEVSGQLFVYRERQQLLPTIFGIVRAPAPNAPAASKPSADGSQQPGGASAPEQKATSPERDENGEPTAVRSTDDPEVAEIIKQLENRRSEAPPPISGVAVETKADATGNEIRGDSGREQSAGPKSLVPEGTIFTDRRGRLVRIGDRLGIAFDGDASMPAEPAMYILRSRALERLESVIASRTGGTDIVMTGRVYTYKNQNYILPLMAQIEPIGQIRPLQ